MALYLEHFGLNEPPFRITPHTDFFFEGADRGATLEALIYAVLHDEGIVKVSGEVGSGKTMLCRVLMERLPQHVATIYLATPSLPRDEILHAIADELDLTLSSERRSVALRELQEHLIQMYAAGRRVVILIDEAHAMPEETLEQVRLLSNLESNRHKLLQIVLFGQPELDETLAKASLRQLSRTSSGEKSALLDVAYTLTGSSDDDIIIEMQLAGTMVVLDAPARYQTITVSGPVQVRPKQPGGMEGKGSSKVSITYKY